MLAVRENNDAKAFVNAVWAEQVQKALDGKGVYGTFGVIVEVHDSMLVKAVIHSMPVVKMPKVNLQA